MLTEIDWAWAAGLFEGEGGVGERMVNLSQKDLWCLNRLRDLFGGTVGNLRSDGTSAWWVCGDKGRAFVRGIYPHLSPRRKLQIDTIFIDDAKFADRQVNSRAIRSAAAKARNLPRNAKGQFYAQIS